MITRAESHMVDRLLGYLVRHIVSVEPQVVFRTPCTVTVLWPQQKQGTMMVRVIAHGKETMSRCETWCEERQIERKESALLKIA